MAEPAAVLDFEKAKAKRFLTDLRDHPFVAVVLDDDGDVTVFEKGVGPDEIHRIREALEETLSERMEPDGDA